MRLLTKAEACRELRLSLSTLNRWIAAGELAVKREPRGQRHRVYVMLDDDPPVDGNGVESGNGALAVARERIRGLEEQVVILQEQLELERKRNAGLANDLKAAQTSTAQERRRWWRFWDGSRSRYPRLYLQRQPSP